MAVTSMANSSITNYNKFNRMDKDSALQAQIASTTGSPAITTDGNATIYSFTGSGSITVSRAGFVELLVIGGGGGGGVSGGGGAGGHLPIAQAYLTAGTETIVVGAGGVGFQRTGTEGGPGNNGITSRAGSFYGVGGGYGAGFARNATGGAYLVFGGGNGGSGGGGADGSSFGASGDESGGSGTTGQGNAGGTGGGGGAVYMGGGGAGAAATNGDGGAGLANSITGSSVTRAGGGAGRSGTGGTGGGGSGAGGSGTANTGGGGAGSGVTASADGGNGGSGVVIVRVG